MVSYLVNIVVFLVVGLLGCFAAQKALTMRSLVSQDAYVPVFKSNEKILDLSVVILSVITGVVSGYLFNTQANPLQCAWLLVGFFCAVVILLCDIRARIIPVDVAVFLIAFGVIFNLNFSGAVMTVATLCFSAFIFAICFLVSKIDSGDSFGFGDVYTIPAVICYLGVSSSALLIGLVGSVVVTAITFLILLLTKKVTMKSLVPFGPSLALWLWFGCISPLVA